MNVRVEGWKPSDIFFTLKLRPNCMAVDKKGRNFVEYLGGTSVPLSVYLDSAFKTDIGVQREVFASSLAIPTVNRMSLSRQPWRQHSGIHFGMRWGYFISVLQCCIPLVPNFPRCLGRRLEKEHDPENSQLQYSRVKVNRWFHMTATFQLPHLPPACASWFLDKIYLDV